MLSKYYTSLPQCINESVNILLIDFQALSGNVIHRDARMGISFHHQYNTLWLCKHLQSHYSSLKSKDTWNPPCQGSPLPIQSKKAGGTMNVSRVSSYVKGMLVGLHPLACLFVSGSKQCFQGVKVKHVQYHGQSTGFAIEFPKGKRF